jgi:uncharacterized protein (DUF924 family)
MNHRGDAILAYWFGDHVPATQAEVDELMSRWFGNHPELDGELRKRFASKLEQAASGALESWTETATGRLAVILLLDQFPRNVHRGSRAAFAQDAKALALTLDGIESRMDLELSPLQRVFFYMPMQHVESLPVQERAVRCFESLARADVPPHISGALQSSLRFARLHRDIIARFGRFPHRNRYLGRQDTDEERAFLAGGGPSFGQ